MYIEQNKISIKLRKYQLLGKEETLLILTN